MKIIVDAEAKNLIQQLCDVALRSGGLRNMEFVLTVLNNMENHMENHMEESGNE